MDHDERLQRAAHADAQRNIATATAMFGYQPPKRSAPVAMATISKPVMPAAPPPVTAAALAAAAEKSELQRLTAELLVKVEASDKARAGWRRLAAEHNGATAAAPEPSKANHGWTAIADRHNAEQGEPTGEAAVAQTTAGPWDAFLPDHR